MKTFPAFFLLLLLTCISGQAELSCVETLQKISPDTYDLGLGDRIRIKLNDAMETVIEGQFLGKWQEDSFSNPQYGVLTPQGELVTIEARMLERESASMPEVQSFRVRCQEGGTCAVHSTFNGLQQLAEWGESSPLVKRKLEGNPEGLLQVLLRTGVNAEVRDGVVEGKGFWQRMFTPSQIEIRLQVLGELGIEAERTSSLDKIRRHLLSGRPVILDSPLSPGFHTRTQHQANGSIVTQTRGQGVPPGKRREKLEDHHSVLAVGYLKSGWGNDKVLVMDSGTGRMVLWEWRDMINTMMDATLLGPHARKRESKARRIYNETRVLRTLGTIGAALAGSLWLSELLSQDEDSQEDEESQDEDESVISTITK